MTYELPEPTLTHACRLKDANDELCTRTFGPYYNPKQLDASVRLHIRNSHAHLISIKPDQVGDARIRIAATDGSRGKIWKF